MSQQDDPKLALDYAALLLEHAARIGLPPDTLREIADAYVSLLEACRVSDQLASEIRDWCASGQAVRAIVRELIQTNAAIIRDETRAAIARAEGREL
jgi:hypothetical protein